MFLKKYLNEFYYNELIDMYREEYINTLDEYNFKEIYDLFKSYKFYFISDIILKYLEIFNMEFDEVKEKIDKLKENLGDNFVLIIGNDLRYLNYVLG